MTALTERLAQTGLQLPELITGYQDGADLPADEGATTLPLYFPGTGEQIARLQEDDASQIAGAISAATVRFRAGDWSRAPVSERQQVFRSAARAIREQSEALGLAECLFAGLPSAHLATRQVPRAADNFDFFADYIGQMAGETFEQLPGYRTVVTRQAAGVAGLYAPWNAPLALSSMQIASCIAFGNSCVVKPSEYTPLSVLLMVKILESCGLPPGVINIVNGRGSETGAALAAAPGVDRIAFTGGGDTARRIMASAAQHLTPVHFELGGKSANIVFNDADLDRAVDGSLVNIFSNSGQICIAGSRILVQRQVADAFTEQFIARTRNLVVGDPLNPGTEVGPMAFAAHRDRVLEHIDRAIADGAQLLCGGKAMTQAGSGYFVAPTVLAVDSNDLPICQDEVFGPVVTIQTFDSDEDAWHLANASRYGLVGYCWTERLNRALAFQQRVDAGTLWINTSLARDLRAPFGGFKESGIGRDGPRQAADFFTEEKATITALEKTPLRKLGLSENS